MKKSGFTLVEILAVLTILVVIVLLVVPNVVKIIRNSREKAYQEQVDFIIKATRIYVTENKDTLVGLDIPGNEMKITLGQLQDNGFIDEDVKNPKTGENFPSNFAVYILVKDNMSLAYNTTSAFNCNNIYEQSNIIVDGSGANVPNIVCNMIPVKWNGTTLVKADIKNTNKDWFDYNTKQWANAITVNEITRTRYLNASVGTTVNMDDILTMMVWIPRYEYKDFTSTTPIEIDVKFVSGTSTTPTTGYNRIHPAFTFGNEELTGFWVGKFETSGTASEVTIKPNLASLTNQNVSDQFNTSISLDEASNIYGYTSDVDTHMMKNSEWGAVAYLSHSRYGVNAEVWTNPSMTTFNPATMDLEYLTGCAGDSVLAMLTTECNQYNTTNGVKASTTGNIYGIYDMSGGAFEYVMDNLNNTIADSGFSSMPESKYYDLYTTTTPITACNSGICYGHALSETSGWYNSMFMLDGGHWLVRGGNMGEATMSSMWVFATTPGLEVPFASWRLAHR